MYGTIYVALLAGLSYFVRRPSLLGLASERGKVRYLRLFALYFVFAFLWTLTTFAQSNEPPLPTIAITGGESPKGTLLAHADAFWYVFDCDGECKGGRQATLVAVPDSEVTAIQFFTPDDV